MAYEISQPRSYDFSNVQDGNGNLIDSAVSGFTGVKKYFQDQQLAKRQRDIEDALTRSVLDERQANLIKAGIGPAGQRVPSAAPGPDNQPAPSQDGIEVPGVHSMIGNNIQSGGGLQAQMLAKAASTRDPGLAQGRGAMPAMVGDNSPAPDGQVAGGSDVTTHQSFRQKVGGIMGKFFPGVSSFDAGPGVARYGPSDEMQIHAADNASNIARENIVQAGANRRNTETETHADTRNAATNAKDITVENMRDETARTDAWLRLREQNLRAKDTKMTGMVMLGTNAHNYSVEMRKRADALRLPMSGATKEQKQAADDAATAAENDETTLYSHIQGYVSQVHPELGLGDQKPTYTVPPFAGSSSDRDNPLPKEPVPTDQPASKSAAPSTPDRSSLVPMQGGFQGSVGKSLDLQSGQSDVTSLLANGKITPQQAAIKSQKLETADADYKAAIAKIKNPGDRDVATQRWQSQRQLILSQ